MNLRVILISIVLLTSGLTGSSQGQIRLIVRADDMGYSNDVGLAIVQAYRKGIVTSASIMPTAPFFDEAVKLCKENPGLAAGIHVTVMGTGLRPHLSPDDVPSLVNDQGFFYDTREEFDRANPDPEEIENEIRAQIEKVIKSGLHFVYLDYHMNPPESVAEVVRKICREQNVIFGQDFSGTSNGYEWANNNFENWPSQILPDGRLAYYDIDPLAEEKKQMFFDLLSELTPGTWLLAIHPGLSGRQRRDVTDMLCSSKAGQLIKTNNIQLISYADLLKKESMKTKK